MVLLNSEYAFFSGNWTSRPITNLNLRARIFLDGDYLYAAKSRWVGRQDSVGLAPPFFDSGGPQTGVWWTKMEGEEFTDDMKIEFEPNKR